jgi:hypothetical protein
MLKKIALWVVFVGLVAVLVVGAINRTNSKVTNLEPGGNQGHGQVSAQHEVNAVSPGANGRNRTERSTRASLEPLASNGLNEKDWIQITGNVIDVNADSLTIAQGDGSQLVVEGRAWRFALESGLNTEIGHLLRVTGFYEDGEFKPASLEDLSSGQAFLLRTDSGQPLWSGRGGRNT